MNQQSHLRTTPEAGKRYVRRNGTISPPLVRYGESSTEDHESGFMFVADGLVLVREIHPKDLMYEYIETHDFGPYHTGEWED